MPEMTNNLPELRPICAICVVEDHSKCPDGFSVIRYTNDNKSEADLWRDGYSIFARRKTRYLCYARASPQEEASYVVESIAVVSEGETPPSGYTAIQVTKDTGQRALKKKLVCYQLAQYNRCAQAVYEVAVLSTKRVPDGFMNAGEVDGIHICFKVGPGRMVANGSPLPYSLPTAGGFRVYPALNGVTSPPTPSWDGNGNGNGSVGYGNGGSVTPTRRAPAPPPRPDATYENFAAGASASAAQNTYDAAHYGLEGVPFELSGEFKLMGGARSVFLPEVKAFTEDSWNRDEFKYDFRTEKDVMSVGNYTVRR